uniref:Reverse transcriptase domain-containing protein n=1 Tax=Haemonchus contortus TaxID=6289 RepID=A0A7I4YG49_HAECO
MRRLPRSERPRSKKLVQIRTLNETRWKGAKAREIGEGVKLYYNGDDAKWNGVATAVAETLKDSVSSVNRTSSRIMANDEVQRVVREKKLAYKRWEKTRAPEDLAAYRTYKRLSKAAVAKARTRSWTPRMRNLIVEKERRHRGSEVRQERRGCNPEEAWEVRRMWKEYFDKLLNEEFARENSSQLEATVGTIKLWTEDEMRIAIGKMKVGKATDPDGVPIEAWKALVEHGIKWLT